MLDSKLAYVGVHPLERCAHRIPTVLAGVRWMVIRGRLPELLVNPRKPRCSFLHYSNPTNISSHGGEKTRTKSKETNRRPVNMEPGVGGETNSDLGSNSPASAISEWTHSISRRYQHVLDKSTPHVMRRWIGFGLIALIYIIRVYFLEGFYIVSYGLGIYILNLLIAFLSPQVDPEVQELVDGPTLPTRGSDEFRPFVRRLPEFKFWYSMTKAFCIAFLMTFNSAFDVPVFWPILLFYWMVLFFLTMKRQILHMIKYKYVPFSLGKQRYTGKRASSADDVAL